MTLFVQRYPIVTMRVRQRPTTRVTESNTSEMTVMYVVYVPFLLNVLMFHSLRRESMVNTTSTAMIMMCTLISSLR